MLGSPRISTLGGPRIHAGTSQDLLGPPRILVSLQNPSKIQIRIKSKAKSNKILGNPKEILGESHEKIRSQESYRNPRIHGTQDFVVPRGSPRPDGHGQSAPYPQAGGTPSKAERSGARLAALGATKEVLGSIGFLDVNWDFLGFPIIRLGFPRISQDLYQDSIRILIRF